MLDLQSGPHAASVFTTRPVSPELSRRCRQPNDLFHLAASPRSGARGGPLQRAAACICWEAGATVAPRMSATYANEPVFWGGSQLATGSRLYTGVPFDFCWSPRRAAGRTAGAALALARKAHRAFAASLLSLPRGGPANVDGESLLLSDILADSSLEPPLASRMIDNVARSRPGLGFALGPLSFRLDAGKKVRGKKKLPCLADVCALTYHLWRFPQSVACDHCLVPV